MRSIKIISGGQTGADLAALEAAEALGFQRGGSIPKGFRNHTGFHPEYAELYLMTEHKSPSYPPRTYENVKNSDATLRFAIDFTTAGELCTMKAIRQYDRPHLDVRVKEGPITEPSTISVQKVYDWIIEKEIQILNVAGNSNNTHDLMQDKVRAFMLALLERFR